ncbi:MAG: hypothetical protein GY953_48520, partial [bacterium]|nr:hypothetical protein [bacterium]
MVPIHQNRPTHPSLGGEFVFGVPHGFGIYSEGVWNRVLELDASHVTVTGTLYDFGGGLQWTPFRLGRFAPYLRGGISWVRFSANGHFGPDRFGLAASRVGGSLGFGSRIYLNNRYGVLLDARAIQGP